MHRAMKFNHIIRMAMAVCAIAPITSCTDGNDWNTDSAFDRLFGVKSSNLGVETDDNAPSVATVTFDAYDKNVQYYIVEISTDSLYDEIPMGGANARVFGEDKSIVKSPVELKGLTEYTKYFLRVRAMSDDKAPSNWVYYKSGASFRTPGVLRDIPEADRLDESVRLTWIEGSHVTKLVASTTVDEEPEETTVMLTDADRAAAEYTFTGLRSNKTYTFSIYNGDILLGAKTVKTAKGMPAADLMYSLDPSVTEITQEMLNDLADQALAKTQTGTATLSIGIPAGATLTLGTSSEGLDIPEGVGVNFFGRAGEFATLQVKKSMSIGGNHAYVNFEHLNIDGCYDAETGTKGCEYLINNGETCSLDALTFTQCNIANLSNAIIRMKDVSSGQRIGKLKVDNCVVTNHAGNYALFCFDKGGCEMESINISNSTFYNVAMGKKSFIDVSLCKSMTINIESCTFYNLLGNGAYFINAKNAETMKVNLYKLLLAKTVDPAARGKQGTFEISGSSCYAANDFVLGSGKIAEIAAFEGSAKDMFKDPDNGDFTVKNTALQVEQVGDPRWLE